MFIDTLNSIRWHHGLSPVQPGANMHEALTELDSVALIDTAGGLKHTFSRGIVARNPVGHRLRLHLGRIAVWPKKQDSLCDDTCRCGCQK